MVLAVLLTASHVVATESPAVSANPSGYPRAVVFRENTPQLLKKYEHIRLLISDLHTGTRQFSDEKFKRQNPDALVLIQINNEPGGIWGTWEMLPQQRVEDLGWLDPGIQQRHGMLDLLARGGYPLMDFPGHWVYEAGAETLSPIGGGEEIITVKVSDMTPFRPLEHRLSRDVADSRPEIANALMKCVVIYNRLADGNPDWLNADMGSILETDTEAETITIRRWNTSKPWSEFDRGASIAPNAVSVTYPSAIRKDFPEASVMKVFLPNLSPVCPVDPRTGLTAVETLAKHYTDMKNRLFPLSDGFVFDVSVGTYWPSGRVSNRIDSDNDGVIDNFVFDGAMLWPLGIYEFCRLLREGKPGRFDGLGDDLLLVSDSNHNADQRFFDIFNGGEYEHSFFINLHIWKYTYSSSLDRFLLWEKIGRKPNLTFIHNKYPDEAHHGGAVEELERPATLAHYRLDMATACMGPGYVGKQVGRSHGDPESARYPGAAEEHKTYGGKLPKIYDEYHAGRGEFGWLGSPKNEAFRVQSQWGGVLYRFDPDVPSPAVLTEKPPWRFGEITRDGTSFTATVEEIGLYVDRGFHSTIALPLPGIELEPDGEYVLNFRVKGSSTYEKFGERYRNIPKNMKVRLLNRQGNPANHPVDLDKVDANVAQLVAAGGVRGWGYVQEVLVFPDEREVTLTVLSGGAGAGMLEFDLTEQGGSFEISDLTLRRGCADVMAREFENGVVLVNGSHFTGADFDLAELFPGSSFKRIQGTQDPAHNNGQRADSLTLPPGDGIFLERIPSEKF